MHPHGLGQWRGCPDHWYSRPDKAGSARRHNNARFVAFPVPMHEAPRRAGSHNKGIRSMSRTISTTLSAGITLSPSDNPVSITATGRITAGGGDAIYGYTTGTIPWTVANAGTIVDDDGSGNAVHLKTTNYGINNSFTNQSGGLITAAHNGVVMNGSGVIINQANATITSADTGLASAVYIAGTGTVLNSGVLRAGNIGVYELMGGTVTNFATGTIIGAGGVYLKGRGTITNAGTIIGTNPTYGAVLFDSNAGSSRLIVDPGAVFTGKIISLANSTNVMELASGSSAGTLSGFDGSSITNFATLQFDTGSDWTVAGNSATTGLGSIAITGFTIGDTIDLTGFVAVSETFASNALTLTNASNAHATLHINGSFSSGNFALATLGSTGTVITDKLACFAEGAAIATPTGYLLVEALKAGDLVQTASGDARPVRWIGFRTLDLTRHRAPEYAQPIRITAGAFADNIPSRDLRLSPDHAVLLDGLLIPVKLLRNDASVVRETNCRSVTYYHVELDTHDILLAEGLAAESYLDTGNRGMFANAEQPMALHPDFGTGQSARVSRSCRPFADRPDQVEPVWRVIAERAKTLGWMLPQPVLTDDPDLHLLVGARRINPVAIQGPVYTFVVPPGHAPMQLVSRSACPREAWPWIADDRRLGAMVRGLVHRANDDVVAVAMDDPALEQGWWAVEWGNGRPGRWTGGDARLPNLGTGLLEVELAGKMLYPIEQSAFAADDEHPRERSRIVGS
jgi:hypothetical protein